MIDSFKGENGWLSNMWPAMVMFEGEIYSSAEHAYQASKTLDPEFRKEIRRAADGYKAKKIGRFVNVRTDMKEKRLELMYRIVFDKFARNLDLMNKLLATGEQELVEGNNWNDTFWGRCSGVGENHLGKILMKVREELK